MSSSNRGTKSAFFADETQIREKDSLHGSEVTSSEDSLGGPSHGAKAEESKIAASTQQGTKADEPKIPGPNLKVIESLFRSLNGDQPVVISRNGTVGNPRHDVPIEDDFKSLGCHEEDEWITYDENAPRRRPQIDPKWGNCIAANGGDD